LLHGPLSVVSCDKSELCRDVAYLPLYRETVASRKHNPVPLDTDLAQWLHCALFQTLYRTSTTTFVRILSTTARRCKLTACVEDILRAQGDRHADVLDDNGQMADVQIDGLWSTCTGLGELSSIVELSRRIWLAWKWWAEAAWVGWPDVKGRDATVQIHHQLNPITNTDCPHVCSCPDQFSTNPHAYTASLVHKDRNYLLDVFRKRQSGRKNEPNAISFAHFASCELHQVSVRAALFNQVACQDREAALKIVALGKLAVIWADAAKAMEFFVKTMQATNWWAVCELGSGLYCTCLVLACHLLRLYWTRAGHHAYDR